MKNKLTAIKQTSIFVIIASIIPYFLSWLFDEETFLQIILFCVLGFFVWIMYSLKLIILELDDRFKND